MKNYERYLIAVIIVFAFLLNSNHAKAGHAFGGEITYECLGIDSYLVKAALYRECSGISMPGNVTLGIKSSCYNANLTLYADTSIDITPVCASMCSPCEGACSFSFGGFEAHYYSAVVVFENISCCDITFFWQHCCRGGRNDVFVTPQSLFYIQSTLNRCVTPCNSSIEFKNKPLPFLCRGTDVYMDHFAFEPDGDSLVYELVAPLASNGAPMLYKSDFAPDEPLEYLGIYTVGKNGTFPFGFHFNSGSGFSKFRPVSDIGTLIAVKVTEFRDTVIVGSVTRDYRVYVEACSNEPPVINQIQNINVCSGDTATFEIFAADPDSTVSSPDSVFLEILLGPDNAFIKDYYYGEVYAGGKFTWVPGNEDIGSHDVIIKAYDNGCPMSAYSFKIIRVNVTGFPELEYSTEVACGIVNFEASELNGLTVNFEWNGDDGLESTSQAFSHQYPDTGLYVFNLTASFGDCKSEYTDTVDLTNVWLQTDNEVIDACENTNVTLEASYRNGIYPLTYHWSNNDTGKIINYYVNGNDIVEVSITDSMGCNVLQEFDIQTIPQPNAGLSGIYTLCPGSGLEINAGNTNFNHDWYYLNDNSNISSSNQVILYNAGTYTHKMTHPNIAGCIVTDTFEIFIYTIDTPSVQNASVCPGDTVSLFADGPFSTQYWMDENFSFILHTGNTYQVSHSQPATYGLLSVFDLGNVICSLEQYVEVEIKDLPDLDLPSNFPEKICINDEALNLHNFSKPLSYWTGSSIINDSIFDPAIAGTGTHELTYHVTSNTTFCSDHKAVYIEVNGIPQLDFDMDVNQGDVPLDVIFTSVPFLGLSAINWYIIKDNIVIEQYSGNVVFHTFNDTGEYTVSMAATDAQTGCRDSILKTNIIQVSPSTSIDIPEKPAFINAVIIPNPARNNFEIISQKEGSYNLLIVDLKGRVILDRKNITEQKVMIDVTGWQEGTYILNILKKDEILQIEKLIVR